jgi:hypothetical protein
MGHLLMVSNEVAIFFREWHLAATLSWLKATPTKAFLHHGYDGATRHLSCTKKKSFPVRETILDQASGGRTPSRFPTLALSRSGSTGMISGFGKATPCADSCINEYLKERRKTVKAQKSGLSNED